MKPLLVTSGEPAGVGPDLCLMLANAGYPIVVLGDQQLLEQRAKALNLSVQFSSYDSSKQLIFTKGELCVFSIPCAAPVTAQKLNPKNANYVLEMLTLAANQCQEGVFSGLVTTPVHKAIINRAGISFTGHTEFLANHFQVKDVVMLLVCDVMKVALVTTHLPLRAVPDAISMSSIMRVILQLDKTLGSEFNIEKPRIYVAGLNPHAGEAGYLGREEIEIIKPALSILKEHGLDVHGPFPADTLFTPPKLHSCDAFVAMYHDQGLAVLKYASFNSAVNVTLGLPIIRTSVDHGTALELAGTGRVCSKSLHAAIKMAYSMAEARASKALL